MRGSGSGLRDFSVDRRRFAALCMCAALVGFSSAFLAKLLLMLIGAITSIAYGRSLHAGLTVPDPHRIGPLAIAIPVAGGLIVGLIARFGTKKIRGHGIPEAIASILTERSVMQARVAFWKPIASAIAIGTGGPFGAEGPIIMTGGAFGSLFAQFMRVSAFERRTLLVAGAAGGMAATFGAPIASVLIAVELLLFEWRPRSYVPVAIAAFCAEVLRVWLIGPSPPFLVPPMEAALPIAAIGLAAVLGICGGAASMLITKFVYAVEELYERLPVRWMWWPAIGGLVVGIGGWFVPQTLGVGYPTIAGLLAGRFTLGLVVAIVAVKLVIWVVSLSSGTSGGVLAPLLMIGAGLGAVFAHVAHASNVEPWAIAGMAALMGGTMRAPFMGTLFALETTHAWALAPEIFVACAAATAFTVLFVPRSILTEKLARRGIHVARDYSAHPLEFVAVSGVMRAAVAGEEPSTVAIGSDQPMRVAVDLMARRNVSKLSVTAEGGAIVGCVELQHVLKAWRRGLREEERRKRIRRYRRRA